MTSTLLLRETVLVDEQTQASAEAAVEQQGDERLAGLTLTTTTGREIKLGKEAADLVGRVLARAAQGGSTTIQTVPDLLSTAAAAEFLGVSRPTVMKLIKRGELEAVMAGSHHRLRFVDVMALRDSRETKRREAVEELLELGEDQPV